MCLLHSYSAETEITMAIIITAFLFGGLDDDDGSYGALCDCVYDDGSYGALCDCVCVCAIMSILSWWGERADKTNK